MEASASSVAAGDWVCGDQSCGNVNFSRRSACNRCGKKRGPAAAPAGGAEIGKSAADKSRGLFSADDWQCGKCANVNWARRLTCNVCNAPKFQEVEARTGYGGGYDERGVVEYRQRRDSDDDVYDEFGRVKKRKGKDAKEPKVRAERRRPPVSGDVSSGGSAPARTDAAQGTPPDHPPRLRTLSRDRIMENRVSSTNDVKYVFQYDSFEVTYTLEERIKAAAWAIVHQNCRTSAEKFQTAFDKPAPDFKTIFAWRQRLLTTGCLVDAHRTRETPAEEPPRRRRRRRRYFRPPSVRGSVDSESEEPERRKSGENARPDERAVSANDNTNGSVCRSSTSGAKRSRDDGKRSDCYLSDAARSETPEIVAARVELARLESPERPPTPETRFQDDDYFPECPESFPAPGASSSFLIPEIPKMVKTVRTDPKVCQDPAKSMLEDIVSESERYSSDGDQFESDHNEDLPDKDDPPTYGSKHNAEEYGGKKKSISKEALDLPLPSFGRDPPKDHEKNFSSAMRRIIESMSSKSDDKNIEYVPTKIDPAMAKKNLQLFESIHDIWPDGNSCSEDVLSLKKPEVAKVSLGAKIDDYTPDDDALYRDESPERRPDEILKTPPRAPTIGSISSKTNKSSTNDINPESINSILQFNFSSINTDDIALALKNIQSFTLNKDKKENNKVPSPKNTPTKKNDSTIPFLDDMFYSGSPGNGENVSNATLDEFGESPQMKKSNSTISGFKSFAIPKPILLNRLRNLNRSDNTDMSLPNSDDKNNELIIVNGKLKKRNNQDNGFKDESAKLYDDEEDEESGEEGDLSKYDLCGSDEEGNKSTEDKQKGNAPTEKSSVNQSDIKNPEKPKSPQREADKRTLERSRSGSSKRSSSSSSSTSSSGERPPRNRYDDFILNSEHSRAGSRDDSSSARSRSPTSRSKDKNLRSRDKTKDRSKNRDRSRGDRDRDRKRSRSSRDKSRDKARDRDRDRHRQHKSHSNHGGYTRGRAR